MHHQSAIDVKARRLAEGANRLDPEYLFRWRRAHEVARADYLHGDLNLVAFTDRLQLLGFRDDALRAELLDAQRDINNPQLPRPARSFRYQVK